MVEAIILIDQVWLEEQILRNVNSNYTQLFRWITSGQIGAVRKTFDGSNVALFQNNESERHEQRRENNFEKSVDKMNSLKDKCQGDFRDPFKIKQALFKSHVSNIWRKSYVEIIIIIHSFGMIIII